MVLAVLLQLAIAAVPGAITQLVELVGWARDRPLQDSVGCRSFEFERVMHEPEAAIAQARQAIGKVHLGDSKKMVVSILSAPQGSPLRPNFFKREAPSQIEIYYLRTNWMPDDCLTDDELTPFIFRDGVLVSIGWRTLSGPHSFGTPDTF